MKGRVIVDATGQQALFANRLGLRRDDPDLRKSAIWTYYANAHRDPGEHGGATIILQSSSKKSWFWYIPLSNGVTSVGVVADRDYLLKDRGKPADVFQEELTQCDRLVDRLRDAERQDDFRVAKEFSYSTERQTGDGWLLVGDAFGFIDPIYSSGVFLALKSGELAADAIVEALAADDTSAERLGGWVPGYLEGTRWIRKLVDAYYTDNFSFGGFLREHPEHTGNLTDLLIGRVFYDGAGCIFDGHGSCPGARVGRNLVGSLVCQAASVTWRRRRANVQATRSATARLRTSVAAVS